MNIAIIIAGNRATRRTEADPDLFTEVDGKPILLYTLEAFENHPDVDVIALVCNPEEERTITQLLAGSAMSKLDFIVKGGNSRAASILAGLEAVIKYYASRDIVLLHDAMRPFVSARVISDCIENTRKNGSAISSVTCWEEILTTRDGRSALNALSVDEVRRTQSPQGFRLGKIYSVYMHGEPQRSDNLPDGCMLMLNAGEPVYFSPGSRQNIKLETAGDLKMFEMFVHARPAVKRRK